MRKAHRRLDRGIKSELYQTKLKCKNQETKEEQMTTRRMRVKFQNKTENQNIKTGINQV